MSTEAEVEAIMEWADVTHLQALDALAAVEPLIRERLAQGIEARRKNDRELGFPPAWYGAMDLAARIVRGATS